MKTKKLTILAVFITAFFICCKSVEKQRRNAEKFYKEHPAELADNCAEKYPPKIEYRKGTDIFLPGDTVIIKGETVVCPEVPATRTTPAIPRRVVNCPEYKVIRDTLWRVDTVYIENTARVNSLQYRLQTVSAELDQTKQQLSKIEAAAKVRLWWIIALIVFIAIGVFLRVKKII